MYLISNRNLCSKEKYIKTIVEAAKNNVEYLILREKVYLRTFSSHRL